MKISLQIDAVFEMTKHYFNSKLKGFLLTCDSGFWCNLPLISNWAPKFVVGCFFLFIVNKQITKFFDIWERQIYHGQRPLSLNLLLLWIRQALHTLFIRTIIFVGHSRGYLMLWNPFGLVPKSMFTSILTFFCNTFNTSWGSNEKFRKWNTMCPALYQNGQSCTSSASVMLKWRETYD